MIQDSSCYSGIDPRQVFGMLKELEKLAKETKKQIIVSINKYLKSGNMKKLFA